MQRERDIASANVDRVRSERELIANERDDAKVAHNDVLNKYYQRDKQHKEVLLELDSC